MQLDFRTLNILNMYAQHINSPGLRIVILPHDVAEDVVVAPTVDNDDISDNDDLLANILEFELSDHADDHIRGIIAELQKELVK